MSFDTVSYIMGQGNGYEKGYGSGVEAATGVVVIENGITCTDDGNGNITITEDN